MAQQIYLVSSEQLLELADHIANKVSGKATVKNVESQEGKRFVYGIQGIRDLFNVSQVTAQKYKDTFLQPAVMQRGRKIIVDADLAIKLYDQHQSA